MKVFFSWSGDLSREVAKTLRDWLPDVLRDVEPWLAPSEDFHNWSGDAIEEMASSSAILFCITRDNAHYGWPLREFQLLRLKSRSVIPIVVDLPWEDLDWPFTKRFATQLDNFGITRLVRVLNEQLAEPIDDERLNKIIDVWLPILVTRLEEIPLREPISQRVKSDSETIDQISEQLESLTEKVDKLQFLFPEGRATLSVRHRFELQSEPSRPRVFIGSSTKGLPIAQSIQAGLDDVADCTVWNQALFEPSKTTIENLVNISAAFDFAIIVMTADDVLIKKGNTTIAPRDNLVFELGLFTGRLGRGRAFLVKSRNDKIELPSDLDGVTTVEYRPRQDNIIAAVAPVCLRMKQVMGLA